MRKTLSFATLAALNPLVAQAAAPAKGADQWIQDAVGPFTDAVARVVFSAVTINGVDVPLILGWLIAVAVFCTLYFRFINVRGFWLGFKLIRGDYSDQKSGGWVRHRGMIPT